MGRVSRVEGLLARMTLVEKLGQLTMSSAGFTVTGPVIAGDSTEAIRRGEVGNLLNLVGGEPVRALQRVAVEESRLGIPLLLAFDVVHGHRTLFPVPLAEAGALDAELWARTARAAAVEAAADGIAMTFAPMLDVARDPRWGRGVEGPGEDPMLASRFAAAKVEGFQGGDLTRDDALAAVAKHYCAYGAVTAGRDYASVDVSERTLREVYLPPFDAALGAGVAAVMPAFTDLAGVPLTAHRGLLRDRLRRRLGFEGVIVTDYHAIAELIVHGVAADLAEAAALALEAGVDIDMMSGAFRHGLPLALERGRVDLQTIDAAVRRVLTLKERLGLFADPYRRGKAALPAAVRARHRALAREAACRSLVLLKNDREVLPFGPTLRRLAVVGPLADAPLEMAGPWPGAGADDAPVSVIAGLRAALPAVQIHCAAGVPIGTPAQAVAAECAGPPDYPAAADSAPPPESDLAAALGLCESADAVVLCVGEAARMSGEAASRGALDLPGSQREFAEAVCRRAAARGVPVIVVLFSGRPLAVPWLVQAADAVLAAWFPGSEAGAAIADVLCGRVGPSARTAITWPRAVGQVPLFFGERPSGRPANRDDPYTSKYLDFPVAPLFPFGHGLTYGRFRYTGLRANRERIEEHESLEVSVDLVNEGAHAAEETVFLFTHPRTSSVSRPILELKAFAKVALAAGASGTVTLRLAGADLRTLGADLEPQFEPGAVDLLVGPCADREQLHVLGLIKERAGR